MNRTGILMQCSNVQCYADCRLLAGFVSSGMVIFFGQHLHEGQNCFSHTPCRACHGTVATGICTNALFAVTMSLCLPAQISYKLLAMRILCLEDRIPGVLAIQWMYLERSVPLVITTAAIYILVCKFAAVEPKHCINVTV